MTVWNNKFETYRNRDWTKTNECQECKMFKYCLGGGMHLRGDNKEMLDCLYLKCGKKNNDSYNHVWNVFISNLCNLPILRLSIYIRTKNIHSFSNSACLLWLIIKGFCFRFIVFNNEYY